MTTRASWLVWGACAGGMLAAAGCVALNPVRRWSGPEYHQEPASGLRGQVVLSNGSSIPCRVDIDGKAVVFNPRANPALYADTSIHPWVLSGGQERTVVVSTGTHSLRVRSFDQLSTPHETTVQVEDGDVFSATLESGMSGLMPKASIAKVSGRPAAAPAQPAGDDVFATLEKLKALRDKGVLSEEEFTTKKAELLQRIR